MFQNEIWLPVFNEMQGGSLVSRLQYLTGLSRPTARKYLAGKISLKKRQQADKNAEDNFFKTLIDEGMSDQEAREWFSGNPVSQGKGAGFQSVVYNYLGSDAYPRLDVMAEKADKAMSSLYLACRRGGVEGIPGAMKELEGFSDDYMVSHDPERDVSLEKLGERQKLEIFLRNVCVSFFALLDIECVSRDYPEYEMEPIFINLTPRVSADFKLGEKCPRGGLVLPYFSLVEFMGLLVDRAKVGSWRSVPSVDDIASMANVSAAELAKIRSGNKRLSFKQFFSMWREMGRPVKSGHLDMNRPPVELYLVAAFFQVTFCGKSPSRWIDIVGHEYRYWWNHHRDVVEADPGYEKGAKPLPEWFLQSDFLTR